MMCKDISVSNEHCFDEFFVFFLKFYTLVIKV